MTALAVRWCGLVASVLCATVVLGGDGETAPDFAKDGFPFLDKYCVECHSGKKPEGKLSLVEFRSTADLLKNRRQADRVLEMLRFGAMPPADSPQPTLQDVDEFLSVVERITDKADRHLPPDPGRVTMRRLNRTEYANTVQDLLGIDFNPASNFPGDDVGHGFDNIGDVLTVSPVLMERYLASAQVVARAALSTAPLGAEKRSVPANETEPFVADAPPAPFRRMSSAHGDDPATGGPIYRTYKLPTGEYLFRTLFHTDALEDQPVFVAMLACSQLLTAEEAAGPEEIAKLTGPGLEALQPFKILRTVELKSRRELFPHELKQVIPPIPGLNRVAIALYRPKEGQPDVNAYVGPLTLEGPVLKTPSLFRQRVNQLQDKPEEDRTKELLTWLLRRAFRRPVADAELARFVQFVRHERESGSEWESAIQLAVQAVLVSPEFLFRPELAAESTDSDVRQLDEFQLASRLSYFLWSSMPDDELLSLAEAGQLRANQDRQVRRMLSAPRSVALVDHFALQWLQLDRLKTAMPDQKLFPDFNPALRSAMLEETRLFLRAVVDEDRSVMDLLGADFTFLNAPLARHYGIGDTRGHLLGEESSDSRGEPIYGGDFQRVQFQKPNQGGVLKQASILTVTSNPTRTSPVKRGRWVLEQLMGRSPPPPPPNVPELDASEGPLKGTLRQRMEQHRLNPNCASCHAQMDPIGFAFENYDAIGKFRTHEGNEPVDSSGILPGGTKFQGPDELIEILKGRREEFLRCLAEKLLTYALGRGLEYHDRPAVKKIVQETAADGERFSALVLAIVHSVPFQSARTR